MKMPQAAIAAMSVLLVATSTVYGAAGEARSEAHGARRLRVSPNVAYQDTAGPALVLPVVGSLEGANGTYYRSAVTIMNFRGYYTGDNVLPQRIRVEFYPRGASGSGIAPEFFTLTAVGSAWEDFLVDFFTPSRSGLGAVVITAVNADGTVDPDGRIDAVTRIYTPQASSNGCLQPGGSTSQSMSAIRVDDLKGSDATAHIAGLRHDAKFRTSIGIVNHDNRAHVFTVVFSTFNGSPDTEMKITVEAESMTQTSVPAGDYGISTYATIWSDDAPGNFFYWSAYGSSSDNATGDGWIQKATW